MSAEDEAAQAMTDVVTKVHVGTISGGCELSEIECKRLIVMLKMMRDSLP